MALDFWRKIFGTHTSVQKENGEKTLPFPIFFYNTRTLKKETFESLRPHEVRMYNCGPTVYDLPHLGNLAPYIFADTLRRVLEYNHFEVRQVVNITDVGHLVGDGDSGEDKVELSAKKAHKRASEITETITNVFFEDLRALHIDVEKIIFPRATKHIQEQIAFIKSLDEKGYTYKTSDGIYFDTSKFKEYGKLGNVNLKGLEEGARIGVNREKKHPTDFALWKFSKPEDKRQQEWESPWGIGFPGWHIECSAMSIKYLGKSFDIHTGGVDHIPVHHNNEIAQSESVTGRPFARFWLHCEHLLIDGKKISKSIGNTIYLKNVMAKGLSPLAYRYFRLTSHYRTQTNFTWQALEASQSALFKLQRFFVEQCGTKNGIVSESYKKRFLEAVNDDLNTAKGLALVWELVKDEEIKKEDKRATLLDFDRVLGLHLAQYAESLEAIRDQALDHATLPNYVQKLLQEREVVREKKDFARADEIREELSNLGFVIKDTAEGVRIEKR